ncbi:MAG: hypothetical protein A2Z20_13005 [Bdellovibrionales bacterium RBG_16_40_8]|nr:MAG: hypothetical protein A2Z20_13005 [Bdellovibrionales bacterium RBG_16_40_8]
MPFYGMQLTYFQAYLKYALRQVKYTAMVCNKMATNKCKFRKFLTPLLLTCAFIFSSPLSLKSACAASNLNQLNKQQTDEYGVTTKKAQLTAFANILGELKNHYGMIKYKYETFGTTYKNLESKYTRLIRTATSLEEDSGLRPKVARRVLSSDEFQQLMIGFSDEFRDGHTNILRNTSHYYTLGIKAAALQGHLYITGLMPNIITPGTTSTKLQVGDEIIEINDTQIMLLAKENLLYTQRATAESRLERALESTINVDNRFYRTKIAGEEVKIKFRRTQVDGPTIEFTGIFNWIDFPDIKEQIKIAKELSKSYSFGDRGTESYFSVGLDNLSLAEGSIIDLGKLFNSEVSDKEQITRLKAYMIRYENKNIGVIRIPDYSPPGSIKEMFAEVLWLEKMILRLESTTDVLIIDQAHNGGGYVDYVSRLSQLFANHADGMKGVTLDVRLSDYLMLENTDGSGNSKTESNLAKLYIDKKVLEKLKEKVTNGDRWSGPLPYMGSGAIVSEGSFGLITSQNVKPYTKPVLILNDSRSGSGGDFFPSIMQANKRAKVFGTKSMGLGGPVYRSVPSITQAEMNMRCTMGFCLRSDGLPVENVGAIPDFEREVRPEDLKNNFKNLSADALKVAVDMANGKNAIDIKNHLKSRIDSEFPLLKNSPKYVMPKELILKDLILFASRTRYSALIRLNELLLLKKFQNIQDLTLINQVMQDLEQLGDDIILTGFDITCADILTQ